MIFSRAFFHSSRIITKIPLKSFDTGKGTMKRPTKRQRTHVDVKIEDEVKSKYFLDLPDIDKADLEPDDVTLAKEEDVDIEYVKSLPNKEYFEFLDQKTTDDFSNWRRPLDMSLIANESKNNLPDNFIPIYSKVRLMRSLLKTPVDTMGTGELPITGGKQAGISKDSIDPKNYRLQALIGVMLSSQTRDEVTFEAFNNIMDHCIENLNSPEGLTLDALLQIDEPTLDELIRSVGFHNRKAKFVKQTAQILKDQHDSDIPHTIEGMLALPGVGPKMGYLVLQKAWGKVDGICIDVHVHRLSKMWNWVKGKSNSTPEHTRKDLESWLPKFLWYEINPVLVGFGQVICPSKGKRCDICIASDVCNAVDKKLLKKNPKNGMKELKTRFASNRGDYSAWLEYLKQQDEQQDVKKENGGIVNAEETNLVEEGQDIVKKEENL